MDIIRLPKVKKRHISLSITERCNLNCIYCFEFSKRSQSMSVNTALDILKTEMESPNSDSLYIDFMGGEPFLEFQKIKKICETMWKEDWKKPYYFYATTNGTLVHGEIKKWLEEHSKQFICALSIDGIKKAHDMNRSNSFDRIDISFFQKMWPNIKAKTTCSKQSLPLLADSIIYLSKLGFPEIDLKLAYSFDWSSDYVIKELSFQYAKLVDFYCEHHYYTPPSLLNVNLANLNYKGKKIQKWCPGGVETISFDMDGSMYPCRYFQDLVRNNKLTYEKMWSVDYEVIQNQLKGKCRNCLIRELCRTCYAYNLDTCGDFGVKNNYSCAISRLSAYYSALLFLRRTKCRRGLLSEKDVELMEGAKKVIEAYEQNKWYI